MTGVVKLFYMGMLNSTVNFLQNIVAFILFMAICVSSGMAQIDIDFGMIDEAVVRQGALSDSLYDSGERDAAYKDILVAIENLDSSQTGEKIYLETKASGYTHYLDWRLSRLHVKRALEIYRKHEESLDPFLGFYAYAEAAVLSNETRLDKDSIHQLYEKAFELINQHPQLRNGYAYLRYHFIDDMLSDASQVNERIQLFRSLLNEGKEGLYIPPFILLNIYRGLGSDLFRTRQLAQGEHMFNLALTCAKDNLDSISLTDLAHNFYMMGYHFKRHAKEAKALVYLDFAHAKSIEEHKTHTYLYAKILMNKASCLIQFNDCKLALLLSDSANNIIQHNYPNSIKAVMHGLRNRIQLKRAINRNGCMEVDARQEIEDYEACLNHPSFDSVDLRYAIRDIAFSYQIHGYNEEAQPYYEAYVNSDQSKNNSPVARNRDLAGLARVYSNTGHYHKADSLAMFVQEQLNTLELQDREIDLLYVLINVNVNIFREHQNEKYKQRIKYLREYYFQQLRLSTQKTFEGKFSQGWVNYNYYLISKILAYDAEFQWLTDAEYYLAIENIRSLELEASHYYASQWNTEFVSAELMDRRMMLVEKLEYLRGIQSSLLHPKTDSLDDVIFFLNDSLSQLEQRLKITTPDLSNYQTSIDDLASIQSKINQNQLVVQYFDGVEKIYGISISKTHIKKFWVDRDLFSQAAKSHYHTIRSDKSDHCGSHAHALYKLLLSPAIFSQDEINSITIIPDGLIHNIPFESLCDSEGSPLINSYALSYDLSGKTFLNRNSKNEHKNRLLAIAPFYKSRQVEQTELLDDKSIAMLVRDGIYNLPAAESEASRISQLWGGKLLTGKNANKQSFLRQAKRNGILHLAMHAILGDSDHYNSRLKFGDQSSEDLSLRELGHIAIDADLVTLSACNTGTGKINRGTGSKSLARGFLAAGAKSVVMSLWRVPDKSTEKIMVSFYKHLKTGVTKDVALQQAKLDYLDQVEDPKQAHPYYWAGFVVFGDTGSIQPVSNYLSIKWALAVLSISILLWYFIRRIKSPILKI